jgi:D-psicose/D-tagatose/L-ribulose 3-epimerase
MKIAVSNIAWQLAEEEAIAQIMQVLEIKGVEIATTKLWHSPLIAAKNEIEDYKHFWQNRDIEIVAMQALLFGRADLTIFDDAETRQETFKYLIDTIELGSKLGVKVLVFGAPKNRKIGSLTWEQVEEIAIDFFYKLGKNAAKWGIQFCIEPNPQVYNCDFITNSHQGLKLVNKVDSAGFGLHLDSASMTLSNESISQALEQSFSKLCHFHISEPLLAPIGEGKVNHQMFAETLASLNYQGWTSVEMKAQHPISNSLNVSKALELATKYYGYK